MKKGDFILIDYVGRVSESGEIFDLTKKEVAKKNGIYNKDFRYKPIPVIIGAGFILPGLEENLEKMNVNEKKIIKIEPEKGFGKRHEKLIKMISLNEFKKQDLTPYPGMRIVIKNLPGRVLSVSGGRVRVDFNHPLAGKELEYEVKIVKKITKKREKIEAIVDHYLQLDPKDIDINISENKVKIEIKIKIDIPIKLKEQIAKTIVKWVDKIETIEFSTTFNSSEFD